MEPVLGQMAHPQQQNSFRIDNILTGISPATFNLSSSSLQQQQQPAAKTFVNMFCQNEDMQEKKRESVSSTDDDDEGYRKKKKPRTAFSREQVAELEKKFTERKYLSSAERGELAEKLKLSDMQVKTWFQNRRMKYKRQTEEAELEVKSPKFPYTSFVPYSSFYMPYKATDTMSAAYGCVSPPTTDNYPYSSSLVLSSASAQHLSPPPRITSHYINGTVPSCYQIGSYVAGCDYTASTAGGGGGPMMSSQYSTGDWQRSVLPNPPAP